MMKEHAMEPANARSAWEQLKSRLSGIEGVSGSILSWLQSVIVPMLQMFGSKIHMDVLFSVIVSAAESAVASGGNIPKAILDAIMSNLVQIFAGKAASQMSQAGQSPQLADARSGGQDDVRAAAEMLLEAEQIRLANNPELSESHQNPKHQGHDQPAKNK